MADANLNQEWTSLTKAFEDNERDAWTVQNHVKVAIATHLRVPSPLSVLSTVPAPGWLDDMWNEMKKEEQKVMGNAKARLGSSSSSGERDTRFRPLKGGIAKRSSSSSSRRRAAATVDEVMSTLQHVDLNARPPSIKSCTALTVWKPPPCRARLQYSKPRASTWDKSAIPLDEASELSEALSKMMSEALASSLP